MTKSVKIKKQDLTVSFVSRVIYTRYAIANQCQWLSVARDVEKLHQLTRMKTFLCLTLFHLFLKPCVAEKPPNILLIVADDLRPSIGAYGDINAVTPNIDQLANSGVTFKQAFAQQALCAPSRNSFLTSRRPDTLHLYDFFSYWRESAGNFTTLPQFFKENNYYTKSIGKIFHPGVSSNFLDDYPFSWSEEPWHPSTEIYKDSPVCHTNNGWFSNLVCPVKLQEQPGQTLPDIQSVEEAIKFLKYRKKDDQPFLLAVGFHKPHIPLKFPKKYLELHPIENVTLPGLRTYPPGLPTVAWNPWTDIRRRDDIAALNATFPYEPLPDEWVKKIRQGYFASVSYIDDLIGELLQNLKSFNFHKNTIVVLLGDHGWSLGEHGEWSKYSNFDVALRVPLIFRIPNVTYYSSSSIKFKPIEINEPVELVDIFPTLVDLIGLDAIPKCPKNSSNITLCSEGNSLAPLILGKINSDEFNSPVNSAETQYALSQYPRPGVESTHHPNSDKPRLKEIKFMGYSVRTQRYRYTEWVSWDAKTLSADWTNVNQTEMYDHRIDENENLNLFGRPGLEELEKRLSILLRRGFGVESVVT